jgi:hypothetical protein
MALLHNNVLDAALNHIKTNGTEAEIRTSGNSVLVDGIVLNSGNYGSAGDNSGSGGGRKIQALVSSASDMKAISVSTGGSADHVAIKDASANVLVTASITSKPVNLGSSDQVNVGTTSIILKDPT